jgi:hypothetical protein
MSVNKPAIALSAALIKDNFADTALPVIAILTPTKGRKQQLKFQVEQMKTVAYPQSKIRWIITDTATDSPGWEDIQSMYPSAIYRQIPQGTPLGLSRNIGIEIALAETDAEYMFLMDDDDIVNPNRFRTSVAALQANATTHQVAGASAIYVYNMPTTTLISVGKFRENHALEPTLAFTREYAETHRFDSEDRRGRLPEFMDNWSTPVLYIDIQELCVIIGHNSNTFDKLQLEEIYKAQGDVFNIKYAIQTPPSFIFKMYGTPKHIQKHFLAIYNKDNIYQCKAQRFLAKLTQDYNDKLITGEEYEKAAHYLQSNPAIMRHTMLESVLAEIS